MKSRHLVHVGSALAALFAASRAGATVATPTSPPRMTTANAPNGPTAEETPSEPLPPPAPPEVTPKTEERHKGAAYATAGVFETGGFANFTGASGFTSFQFSPTAGFFILDNFELSAILGLNYVHQTFNVAGAGEHSDHKFVFRILAEPSYHVPFNDWIWGFCGVGLGLASVPRGNEGTSTGFDIAPRVGVNMLVGRAGVFSPAVFVDYTTGESIQTATGSVLGVSTSYGIQAGYTIVW